MVKKGSLKLGLCDRYNADVVDDAEEADVLVVESEAEYSALKHEDETRVFILVIDEGQQVSIKERTLVAVCFNRAAQAVVTFVGAK